MPRHFKFIMLLLPALILSGCAATGPQPIADSMAVGRVVSQPVQCVPYAREVSGIDLFGDAHTWWRQAEPRYARGQQPAPGAVLVLSNTAKMPHGHVAVVRNIISERQIEVIHSNWGNDRNTRRIIYDSMRVEDISPHNDWSRVRFWNAHVGQFGFPYPAKGFIYADAR